MFYQTHSLESLYISLACFHPHLLACALPCNPEHSTLDVSDTACPVWQSSLRRIIEVIGVSSSRVEDYFLLLGGGQPLKLVAMRDRLRAFFVSIVCLHRPVRDLFLVADVTGGFESDVLRPPALRRRKLVYSVTSWRAHSLTPS